jgi:hypothetical protein
MKTEMENRIYKALNEVDLGWYSWRWWELHDEWFAQFDPEEIDAVAEEMANKGIIETNGRGGYRRIAKTWKEKIICKIWD